jgi:uncharacterized protein
LTGTVLRRLPFSVRAAAVLLLAAAVAAADLKIPRSPDQWVTDTAGFLSADTAGRINARLRAYEAESGHQLLVYIGKTTGGYPIEEYAVKAFESWKPGRKGLDDGLILFILADDRKMRIEVGYGLEDKVTDAQAARIINDVLAPKLRAEDHDGGVAAAVDGLLDVISGKAPAPEVGTPAPAKTRNPLTVGQTILLAIGGILFLAFLITHPRLAFFLIRLLFVFAGGGRGGGGGGGGFSGGGGRSGGGGASGGW